MNNDGIRRVMHRLIKSNAFSGVTRAFCTIKGPFTSVILYAISCAIFKQINRKGMRFYGRFHMGQFKNRGLSQ
jgi:hypothetical protein